MHHLRTGGCVEKIKEPISVKLRHLESDDITKAAVRKMISKNDHVKNKDRQDPSSTITLSNDCFISYLNDVSTDIRRVLIQKLPKNRFPNRSHTLL